MSGKNILVIFFIKKIRLLILCTYYYIVYLNFVINSVHSIYIRKRVK